MKIVIKICSHLLRRNEWLSEPVNEVEPTRQLKVYAGFAYGELHGLVARPGVLS